MSEAEEEILGTVIAERYLVHRLLGSGGMGAVYEAEHIHMQKRVALKILHGEMTVNAEVVARFEREAIAAGRIQHPGVVTATDFGQLPGGSFYLALEFVEGQNLAELLTQKPVLSVERTLNIGVQIAAALTAAHAAGIVHRDLKPENVMLAANADDEDLVKVLDFGIAKLHSGHTPEGEERLTRVGVVFGTPHYMSPEQARGHSADARSDLYSLGMIMYEMLEGQTAFSGDDLVAVLTAQMTELPRPLGPQVPAELSQLIAALLEKEPEARPQTAALLGEELTRIMTHLGYFMPTARTSTGARLPSSRGSSAHAVPPPARPRRRSLLPPPGKKGFPFWTMGLVVVGVLVLVIMGLRGIKLSAPAAAEPPAPADPAEQIEMEARTGDRDALGELRRLIEVEQQSPAAPGQAPSAAAPAPGGDAAARQSARYMALGRGYSVIRHYPAALEAYQKAVQVDAHVAEDPELLLDVRVALEQRDAMEGGIDFAKESLGAPGADLIYDIWRDFRGKVGMTPVVARALKVIRDKSFRDQATPALQVALDLEWAEACAEYREILPRAVQFADDRSLLKLEALVTHRGCGSSQNRDCFACLRGKDVPLDAAIAAARSRKAPQFLSPPAEGK